MTFLNTLPKILLPLSLLMLIGCGSDFEEMEKWEKPEVNAGSDQLHTLPKASITLNGSVKIFPKNAYTIKGIQWTQVSGPAQLTILNDSEAVATIANPTTAGTYEFQLYAKDSGDRTNTDRVKIVLQEAVATSLARKTAGYSDDFQATWELVADHYSGYADIEQQWHELYQPYLVKAENTMSDENWQSLLENMLEELDDPKLVIQAPTQYQMASAYSTKLPATRESASASALHWKNDNGVGVITFNDLSAISMDQLSSELSSAVQGLTDVEELQLAFSQPDSINEQTLLKLMAFFTRQPTGLVIYPSDNHLVTLSASPFAIHSTVTVLGEHHNAAIAEFNQYLQGQQYGEPSYSYFPSFVVPAVY
ncbi:hypothetical protein K6Q96_23810 [Grimontia kaedaensis]|uniref:Uncharacterized protein n=1 Tax=Grimontia kaedaensis TaxID=2872157 RepID=A0ABY4X0G9_9GAMM|nr:hypothetical protein [Grimontia kaedaensis]USH04742.1 hypothetical protein K6Q96_23810 [Grimontia kaedaensis]